ncbi:MAG: protein translocase subunit SecD [Caulobacter sp.]|nr:protein translocase subunit SecD [Caulobacter sp.]
MMQLSRWKLIVVITTVVLGILFAFPNVLPPDVRAGMPGFLPKNTLNLGLDLQGGSYLLLEVQTEVLQKEKVGNLGEEVRRSLEQEKIPYSGISPLENGVTVRINDPAKVDAAYSLLSRQLTTATSAGSADIKIGRENNQLIRLTYTDTALNDMSTNAVNQAIEIIRRRIDEIGTKETSITRQGANRIVVQAPGESDPEKLKNIIGKTAKLTFQMVDVAGQAELRDGIVPPGSELLPNKDGGETLVKKRVEVSGDMLTHAGVGTNQNGQTVVDFRLNSEGARRFGAVTSRNIGKPFAIILDGVVQSAPVINDAITTGQGQISGSYTVQTANELSILLNAGALPAPLKVEEQRTVGAELGADAVKAGQISTLVGFVSILVFMFLAYGVLFGGISIIALLVNCLLIVAAMSLTQATLTLPGIAGLILTLAVAVDANVLIYERMRDEVRAGRPLLASMDAGFSRAMSTIVDANLTTLIAAAIMFGAGAGPVRGFAWTLSIGVFTSVFAAVLITQVLLAVWYRTARPKTLPIA